MQTSRSRNNDEASSDELTQPPAEERRIFVAERSLTEVKGHILALRSASSCESAPTTSGGDPRRRRHQQSLLHQQNDAGMTAESGDEKQSEHDARMNTIEECLANLGNQVCVRMTSFLEPSVDSCS